MTIGMFMPVKDGATIVNVPWGMFEQHRARALKNHQQTLERIYGRGGLSLAEAAAIVSDAEVADIKDDKVARDILGIAAPAAPGADPASGT